MAPIVHISDAANGEKLQERRACVEQTIGCVLVAGVFRERGATKRPVLPPTWMVDVVLQRPCVS